VNFNQAWIASGVAVFAALGVAPLVLGTWIMVQRIRGLLAGLWLGFLLLILAGALAVGAFGLLALASTPL